MRFCHKVRWCSATVASTASSLSSSTAEPTDNCKSQSLSLNRADTKRERTLRSRRGTLSPGTGSKAISAWFDLAVLRDQAGGDIEVARSLRSIGLRCNWTLRGHYLRGLGCGEVEPGSRLNSNVRRPHGIYYKTVRMLGSSSLDWLDVLIASLRAFVCISRRLLLPCMHRNATLHR